MKAAVVHSFDAPLSIEDVPIPEPGPEQVLVRIEASGLCHTDIHAARGEWPVSPRRRSSRAMSAWASSSASVPAPSRRRGGHADAIDPLDAAPLTCAGVTTFNAVKVSGADSSSLVAVFGAGGLGHLAIQYARTTGASVVAVDTNADRLETARELGAEHVVHTGEEDPVAASQRLGGADAAVSTAVNPSAFEQALHSMARGGTLVCVGLPGTKRDEGADLRDSARRTVDQEFDRGSLTAALRRRVSCSTCRRLAPRRG